MYKNSNCNLCAGDLYHLKNFGKYPIVNQLLERQVITEPPFFDFSLCVCSECGLSQLENVIDQKLFYTNYATPSSEKFNPHIKKLIARVKEFAKSDSRIIEIGCNDGTFLDKLIAEGYRNIFGLEPTHNTYKTAISKGHKVSNSFLTDQTIPELTEGGLFDLVITRQVLEHISNLQDFGLALNSLLNPDGYLIIEVPNANQNLQNFDYSLWEEHVNYFTPLTLNTFLISCGFEIVVEWESIFAGECISIVARKKNTKRKINQNLAKNEIVKWIKWSNNFENFKNTIHREIKSLSKGKELVLYGVGARSSVFVNFLDLSHILAFAIDDSIFKQKKYMPYSKTKIISLEDLQTNVLDRYLILLGVNAENENRIIRDNLFIKQNSHISILPPSENLPLAWKQFNLNN